MGRKLTFVVAAAILIGCIAVAAILIARRPETARQAVPSRIPFVSTATVTNGEGPIPVYGGGIVRAHAEVNVTAEVSGRIVWVNPAFQSGGQIPEGDILFRVDDADYLGQVDRAKANVAAQKVELMRVTAEADLAKIQFENREGNQDPELASPLALWEPQIEAARSALKRDQTDLAEAELRLSRTAIYSPFSAAVVSESVAVGEFVTAGQSVGRLYAVDAVEVVVPLPDESAALIPDLWKLEPGMNSRRITARVSAQYGNNVYLWTGYVDRAEAALEQETRTIEVVIRVPAPFTSGRAVNPAPSNNFPPLLVGKFVEVEIDGAAPEPYFRIRRSALRPNDEVWVVLDTRIRRVPVQVLQRSKDEVFVTGELAEGQAVVVSGIQTAIDGMTVRTGS